MSALGDADMNKFLDRSSTLLISTSVPLESIRQSSYKAKAFITKHRFGCCAVCSTKCVLDEHLVLERPFRNKGGNLIQN